MKEVKRNLTHSFNILPERWIVEIPFSGISFQRGFSEDFIRLSGYDIVFVYLL
jgi:hypothetical protein